MVPGLMRDGQVKPEMGVPVDMSLEICEGLVGAWIFADFPITDGPGSTYDSLGSLTGLYNVTAAKSQPGKAGVAMALPGNNSGVITLPLNAKTNLGTDLTIASRFQWQGSTPNYNPVMSKWDTGGSQGYGLSLNPTYNLRCDSYNSSGSVLNGSTTIAANTWYDAVYSLSSVSQQLFLNGISDATPNASPTMPGTGGTSPIPLIGGDNGHGPSDNRGWNGLIEYVYLFARALSQEEALLLHFAPYYPFGRLPLSRFYSIAGAAFSAIAGLSRSVARAAASIAATGAMAGLSASVAMARSAPPTALGAMAGFSSGVSRDLAAPPTAIGAIAGLSRSAGSGLGTLSASASLSGLSRSVARVASTAPVNFVLVTAPQIVLPTDAAAVNDGITSAVPLNDGVTSAVAVEH